jgi:predicted dehydrogenase
MAQLRLGVIGIGEVGASLGRALARDDRIAITALCDVDGAAMDDFGSYLPKRPDHFSDYADLLARDTVDAVFVGTPNALHAPVAVAALRQGKHLLITKPLAGSLPDAEAIATHCPQDVVAMMALPKRYEDGVQYLSRLARRGYFGDIYHARVRVARRSGIPSWSRVTIGPGGGVMRDMGVHFIDAAWWLMGRPDPLVALGASGAKFGPRGRGYWSFGVPEPDYVDAFASDDYTCGTVCFENGSSMQIETFWAVHAEQDFQLEIHGTEGGAKLNPLTVFRTVDEAPHTVQIDLPKGPVNPRAVRDNDETPSFWRRISAHFVDCAINGETCDAPVQDGLVVQRIMESLIESAAVRSAVQP